MQRKKVTRTTLIELAQRKEIISFDLMKTFVGGGNGTWGSPFTAEEYKAYKGEDKVYYLDSNGEICCNLPEVIVSTHKGGTGGYKGGTFSDWFPFGGGAGFQGGSYSGGTWFQGGSYNGDTEGENQGDTKDTSGQSTSDNINKLSDAVSINTYVKEALFKLAAKSGDLGKAVNTYLRVNNAVGALSGVFNAYVSLEVAFEKPTPGNVSKAVISTVVVSAQIMGRFNPWTGLVLSISDITGLSTLVYEGVDKLTNSN